MQTRARFALVVLALGLAHGGPVVSQTPGEPPTAQIATAAHALLATLSDAQRSKVLFSFDDDAQRKRWSNLPTGPFTRAGLRMGDLTEPQRAAVRALLTAALSPEGYTKVMAIVEADEQLRLSTGRAMFGSDEYYVSFVGEPSTTAPWLLQFGGHHLALNITLAGDQGTLAPSHTAAQPATYEFEGRTVQPLGREVELSGALLRSLDAQQREQAILGFQVRDLVLGPGRDGQTIQPEGIKGSELTARQRELLLELAGEWTGISHAAFAREKRAELEANVEETWFAWSGPTEAGKSAYFRIQGPTVHIEYAPQGRDDPTTHVHTIYRDPTNEYGARWWAR
jgi:hypothetical protein